MKILIISYYYAPTTDAHAYRWAQIAKHWVTAGHEVEIITGSVRGSPANAVEYGVHVTRTGLISKVDPSSLQSIQIPTRSEKIRRSIIQFFRPIYRKIYWPDSLWHWMPSVATQIFRRRCNKYDLVVSYYPCLSASLAVELLRLFTKYPEFTWIADYGDPFCASDTWQPNNYALYDTLNRKTERRFAKSARLVFTNESTASAYRNKLNIQENIYVIPHLVDFSKFHSSFFDNVKVSAAGSTELLYIGGFHRNIREPFRLIELIRRLNAVNGVQYLLNIYGPRGEFNLSIPELPQVRFFGPIERERAVELLKEAEFIINVDNENCVMTPSKIVECISTGRPIINISNTTTDYDPLRRYADMGYVLSIVDKQITDATAIEVVNFINMHKGRQSATVEDIAKALNGHSLEAVSDQYICLMR